MGRPQCWGGRPKHHPNRHIKVPFQLTLLTFDISMLGSQAVKYIVMMPSRVAMCINSQLHRAHAASQCIALLDQRLHLGGGQGYPQPWFATRATG